MFTKVNMIHETLELSCHFMHLYDYERMWQIQNELDAQVNES